MAGFDNDVVYGTNADYSNALGGTGASTTGQLLTNGQVWMGVTAANAGGTHVNVVTLTAGAGVTLTQAASTFTIGLTGGSAAVEHLTGNSGGQLNPDGSNNFNILGATVAAGTSPLVTVGSGSTITINAQRSQALAAADSTKVGLSNFNSAQFSVDANGFVSTSGTGVANTITGNSGGALSPTAGNWNILGASTAAGTSPVTTSGAASTLTVNVQKSQAISATDATKVGLANFNSTQFSVDANGFVSSITGSFTWVDVTTATQALSVQTGYVTDRGAGVTYTLPATAALGDQIRIVGKLGITTIAQNANQQILMSSASSTVGVTGSIVGTNVGDCVWLVCITAGTSTVWRGESFVGNWTVN